MPDFFGNAGRDYSGQALSIKGLQQMQRRNLRRIRALKPGGVRGRAVQMGATRFDKALKYNTAVDTGSLRASRRITFNNSIPRAIIFTSGNAANPRSNTPPAEYDVYLHARGHRRGLKGGWLDSFPATMHRQGPKILADMTDMIQKEIRNP